MAIFSKKRTGTAAGERIPPIVVRKGQEADEDWWRGPAARLEPVIKIMDRLGLSEAGFAVVADSGVTVSRYSTNTNDVVAEKLALGRQAIREAAQRDGTFWGLPEPLLHYRGLVVALFGDERPGEPREYSGYQQDRRAHLVPVRPAQIVTAA